jgi:hypothetical protein
MFRLAGEIAVVFEQSPIAAVVVNMGIAEQHERIGSVSRNLELAPSSRLCVRGLEVEALAHE